jgi:hypothetical protein
MVDWVSRLIKGEPVEDVPCEKCRLGWVCPRSFRCQREQQSADTKRTHQQRHARRPATHPQGLTRLDLQENRVAGDLECTRVTLRNLHGKEGVDGSSPSEGLKKSLQIGDLFGVLVACSGDTRSHRGRTRGRRGSGAADPLPSGQGIKVTSQAVADLHV